jgi:hypothetical protein
MSKTNITENGVLKNEIEQLMTPKAIRELKDLSPTMQQFLLRWQDKRDVILGDKLKEELKDFLQEVYEQDNENVCKNVASVVGSQLAETLSPFYSQMEGIAKSIKDMNTILTEIQLRLTNDETILINLEKRILHLERYASIGWTMVRNLITAAISISVGIILFLEIHSRFP